MLYTDKIKYIRSILQYCSDLHLEKGFKRTITATKPYLVLAGDIGYPREQNYKDFLLHTSKYFDKVFVVSGNHEYDYCYSRDIQLVDTEIEHICSMRNNLFFLQKNTHVLCNQRNIVLAGCTLWSTLPLSKHKYHFDHVQWLKNTLKDKQNDYIIATHHCPMFEILRKKNTDRESKYFATDQSDLLENKNILM